MSVGSKTIYRPRGNDDVAALVDEFPLAWIVSGGASDPCATPLPLQLHVDDDGRPLELVGHFARNNPHLEVLEQDPQAVILLIGPQGYVSPSWFTDRTQAPTWNYACAMFRVQVHLEHDETTIHRRLDDLIEAMEAGRPNAWSGRDMGPRYASLSRGVVGFHATVDDWCASFKLGQDENDETFAQILAGLRQAGEHALPNWMQRFAGNEREQTLADPPSPAADRPSIDADIARFVDTVTADRQRLSAGQPQQDLELSRRIAEQVRQPWAKGGPCMYATRDIDVPHADGPIRVRIHDPSPQPGKPVMVYAHGGGWIHFSLDTHDRLMREYAQRSGMVVVGVEYALAPEHKYPRALNQMVAVVGWLRAQQQLPGLDTSRLVIGGDSAGANLALATVLALRAADGSSGIRGLVLNYGCFDPEMDPESRRRLGTSADMLSAAEVDMYWDQYLRDPNDRMDPLACPLRADLAGLPPTLLIIPECDVLASQSLLLQERMQAAKVRVTAYRYPGATHSFLEAVSIAPLAVNAMDASCRWLQHLLETGGSIHV